MVMHGYHGDAWLSFLVSPVGFKVGCELGSPNMTKANVMLRLSLFTVFTPTDPARLVRTESVPCDINNPVRKPARYSDLHISQTLPKTNKINKVRCGFYGASSGGQTVVAGGVWEGGENQAGA